MLNFRKLKKDYSPAILKEGKILFDKKMVDTVKILSFGSEAVRLSCRVQGNFKNSYHSEIEIDRGESATIDSDCDCTYKYDCQHLAAVLFYLEEHFDEIVVEYSKQTDLEEEKSIDKEEKKQLLETFQEAKKSEEKKRGEKHLQELIEEYVGASEILGRSPYFMPEEKVEKDSAELAVIFNLKDPKTPKKPVFEIQLALRLPFRSKPLNVPNIKEFLDAVRYQESLYVANRRYFFSLESFEEGTRKLVQLLLEYAKHSDQKTDKGLKFAEIEGEDFGTFLAQSQDLALHKTEMTPNVALHKGALPFPCLYVGSLEEPMNFSCSPALLKVDLEYLEVPAPKILLSPSLKIDAETQISLEDAILFACEKPGLIYQNTYHRFQPQIRRTHLKQLDRLREITIPEPLFGTFVENSLTDLMSYAEVSHQEIMNKFTTLPFVGQMQVECDIAYLDGELEATVHFVYDSIKVPSSVARLSEKEIMQFVTEEGVLARNLTQEQKILEDLFQGFVYDPQQGIYSVKNDKKIVEFMTETIPQNTGLVKFNCPENLLDQFVYDQTKFTMHLSESDKVDCYKVDLKVDGDLRGVTVEQLWDCLASRRAFIQLAKKKAAKGKGTNQVQHYKTLVLDLDKLAPVVQIFDELGIGLLDNHIEERPLWSLASITASQFENLPITFSMTDKLQEIQKQILGLKPMEVEPIPKDVKATLRNYQEEGVHWLDRLRKMHLNGILADDMGLGKTVQAITSITQYKKLHPKSTSIIVAPTSLLYNWQEEFAKFNPKLSVIVIDGTPTQRKKLQGSLDDYDVIITSYSLVQKDIDFYKTIHFGYALLDEAQHIKNRGTRNAKSVKMLVAAHKLILTGTPIENSLDELWSLFDFLMPGLLSSYDRFIEKYIRSSKAGEENPIETLKKKVSPFILRRMKSDVLAELPPVSELVYHCHLSDSQKELYRSYADSARQELSELVKKEGFDKIQIHILATLTRLKQICCHPAIFAKEKAEPGDSAKYELMMELLQTLMEGNHKTVIFSQYTRMLKILKDDLEQRGIPLSYLDGSSKNRLEIVKEFNENPKIPFFLVSLKAGGAGLNLTGADSVIHYDMWWNPAVENQATDRVHRIGQKKNVSSYKLVTLGTIEEKIVQLQDRKRGLVRKVVSSDEEAISKLTWEEVLELLQT